MRMRRPIPLFLLSLLAIGECLAEEVTLPANAIMRSGYNLTSIKAGSVVEIVSRGEGVVTIRYNGQTGTIEASSLVAVTPTPTAPEGRPPPPTLAGPGARFVTMGDKKFYQIFAPADSPVQLREYIPEGETVEHWSHLVSVRVFKDISNPAAYLQSFSATLAKYNPMNRFSLLQSNETKDMLLDFLIFGANAQSQQFAEWSLMRAKYSEGVGLIVYQYAVRYYTFGTETAAKVNAERSIVMGPFATASFKEEQVP